MLLNMLKVTIRNIKRQKAFSLITIASLTVGLTAALLIFFFLFQELRYDRFHEKGENIVRIGTVFVNPERTEWDNTALSHMPLGPALIEQVPEVLSMTRIYTPNMRYLKIGEEYFDNFNFLFVDPDFFSIFSFPILETADSIPLEKPNTAYITESAAERFFGNKNPIGKSFIYDKEKEFLITGIVNDPPIRSHIQFDFLASFSSVRPASFKIDPGNWKVITDSRTYALIQPDTDLQALERKVNGILAENSKEDLGYSYESIIQEIASIHVFNSIAGDLGKNYSISSLIIVATLGLFILLLAVINFINLATARSSRRAKEVGLRKVIGAGRTELILQFINESVILTLLALLLSLVIAELLLPFFSNLVGTEIVSPYFSNPEIIATLLASASFVGIVAGLYPGIYLSRPKSVTALKGIEKGGSLSNAVTRKILVVAQFSISVALIIGTFMVLEQLDYMRNAELGFKKSHIVSIPLFTESFETAKTEILKIKGVNKVSAHYTPPLSDDVLFTNLYMNGIYSKERFHININAVDNDYFDLFDLKLLAGRTFDQKFTQSDRFAMVVNEATIRQLNYENPEEAIGKSYYIGVNDTLATIIGVMADYHFKSLRREITPMALITLDDLMEQISVEVDEKNVAQTLTELEALWNLHVSNQPFDYTFVDEYTYSLYKEEVKTSEIAGTFAGIAIFLACLGLFGLAAFSAEQRQKEIGIRKILGASMLKLTVLLINDFILLVFISILIAAPVAYYLMQEWLSEFAYTTTISPLIFILAGLIALIIAITTTGFQALRTAALNPIKTLRHE